MKLGIIKLGKQITFLFFSSDKVDRCRKKGGEKKGWRKEG